MLWYMLLQCTVAFVVLDLVFQNVTELTCFVSGGTLNVNSVILCDS